MKGFRNIVFKSSVIYSFVAPFNNNKMAKKEGTVLLSFNLRTVCNAAECIHAIWPITNEVLINSLTSVL